MDKEIQVALLKSDFLNNEVIVFGFKTKLLYLFRSTSFQREL